MAEIARLRAVSILETQFEPLSDLALVPPIVNIGRALTNDHVIPHISISRQHCCFKKIDNSWFINDKSSTGIIINNESIPKGIDHPLKHNDVIQLDFNGCFVYNFTYKNKMSDNRPLSSCTHSDIFNWIQNSDHESNPHQNKNLNNVASQLQTFEEKRVAVVNQKNFLQSKHTEDLMRLENSYQIQIKQLKGDSEAIKQQKEELLLKVEKDKEELELKFKATTDSLEQKIKKYASQVEELMEENKTLIENFNNERNAYENQIKQITKLSETKVENLKKMLSEKDSHFIKVKELMERKRSEDAIILENNSKLITEYKNKCIALEEEKKETKEKLNKDEDKISTKIEEIETKMENSTTRKRRCSEMQCSSNANYSDILESELVCTICMEYLINAVTLGCSHTFCKHCIAKWKKQSRECPYCRVTIISETDCRTIDSVVEKMVLNLSEDLRKKRQDIINERKFSGTMPAKKICRTEDSSSHPSGNADSIQNHLVARHSRQNRRVVVNRFPSQARTRPTIRQNLHARASYSLRRRDVP